MPAIGQSVPRREGRAKVTGHARYIADLSMPGMLYGATVRSPLPRGVIRDIKYGAGIPWDDLTIVTAADIPGANVVALITDDQPYLASEQVNHAEEPIVLLAHPDPVFLEEARRSITIDDDVRSTARYRLRVAQNLLVAVLTAARGRSKTVSTR